MKRTQSTLNLLYFYQNCRCRYLIWIFYLVTHSVYRYKRWIYHVG